MKAINYILLLIGVTFSLLSCEREKENVSQLGAIYGVITDFATGEPIHSANVQLRPTGETTLTGSDGRYEFLNIEDGNYSITVSKAEYTDLVDDYVIKVKDGYRMRRDVQIEKIPTYIRFTDVYGNDIRELDFGSNTSTNLLSFNIYNNGTVTIDCRVAYSCSWISSVSDVPSSLKQGQNVMVTIQIDRTKLEAGQNITNLYVTSNNGSNVLRIKAIGNASLPDVTTLPVTNENGSITPWCNTFHAEVTSVGNPAYSKRGFCYSSTTKTPTVNNNRIDVQGTGLGKYSYTYWNFPAKTITYYVRAWVMYGSNNEIQYGNVISFTYNDVN